MLARTEAQKQAHLEREAERRGTTVEALKRPQQWAPLPERRRVYLGLMRDGLSIGDVYKLYPNENYSVLHLLHSKELVRRANELEELL